MPKSKFHIGMMQAWIDVAKYYYATIAQTVVLTGVLKFNQLTWGEIGLILIGILVVVCVVGVLHMKFIYPKHSKYLYNKNPVIQEFRKEFAKINKHTMTPSQEASLSKGSWNV
jgi:hypothetical protein